MYCILKRFVGGEGGNKFYTNFVERGTCHMDDPLKKKKIPSHKNKEKPGNWAWRVKILQSQKCQVCHCCCRLSERLAVRKSDAVAATRDWRGGCRVTSSRSSLSPSEFLVIGNIRIETIGRSYSPSLDASEEFETSADGFRAFNWRVSPSIVILK